MLWEEKSQCHTIYSLNFSSVATSRSTRSLGDVVLKGKRAIRQVKIVAVERTLVELTAEVVDEELIAGRLAVVRKLRRLLNDLATRDEMCLFVLNQAQSVRPSYVGSCISFVGKDRLSASHIASS